MADYVNTPFAQFVDYIDKNRKAERQRDDDDLDKKIALIHDLISGPGANPARTAEGISSILELQNAKGGKGRRKKSGGGFMGEMEPMMPEFLANLIHGEAPYEGPSYTESQKTIQQPGFERNALSPMDSNQLPRQMSEPPQSLNTGNFEATPASQAAAAGFDGRAILNAPIDIPPPPIDGAPTSTPMMSAARQMQKQEMVRTPMPPNLQPYRLPPNEQAEIAGHAAGVMSREKQKGEDQGSLEAWLDAGGTADEWRAAQLQKMRGYGNDLTMQEGGYYMVGDRLVHAVRQINPRTRMWDLVDSASGMPLPPDAVPTAAPSSAIHEGTPDQQSLDAYLEAEKAKLGRDLNPQERSAAMERWQTADNNRRTVKPSTVNITLPGSGMTVQQARIFNPIVQHYQQSAPVKAVSRMAPLAGAVQRIKENPGNAFPQLSLIYGEVQALDTYQSTVREGEIRLTQQTMGMIERLKTRIQSITSAKLLSPQAALGIASEAEALMGDIRKSAVDAAKMYRSQASVNGLAPHWDEFMTGAGIDLSGGTGGGQGAGTPQVGDTRTAKNGLKLYFDGTNWTDEVILPNPPGGVR